MGVKIIPENFASTGAGAEAERKVLEFLKMLPDTYYVLQECKIYPSVNKHTTTGSIEDRPDFIVIGPEIGVVVLEVKDWNINTNLFVYHNQKEVIKTDLRSSQRDILTNPKYQAEEYLYAVKERLAHVSRQLWVSSFVIYPKLVRNDFENRLTGMDKSNPQVSFMYDDSRTLFFDDLSKYRNFPHTLLQQYVERGRPKLPNRHQLAYTEDEVKGAVYYLVPAELRIGGLPENGEAEKTLALLDSRQQLWALSTDLQGKKYLADVAGSGKTNILLSRAIYLAKQHITKGGCSVLVVTYSKALELELKRIFIAKIADDLDYDYYLQSIRIYNVLSIMEEVAKTSMREDFSAWKNQYVSAMEELYIEKDLPEKCIEILAENEKDLQIFDYLLIDEIQDFSTPFLYVTINLLKNQQNIFTVGDIGQKLFEREVEWGALDIVKQRVEMLSRFLMYRSPRPIAKLAWKFLTHDEFIRADLEQDISNGVQLDQK